MLWSDCLKILANELPDHELNTWLRTLHGQEHDDILLLLAPNDFVLKYVHNYYLDRIVAVVRQVTRNDSFQVRLQIGSVDSIPAPPQITIPTNDDPNKEIPITQPPPPPPPPPQNDDQQLIFANNLNPALTFDNFVEGKSNQLARASALQVGDNPGLSYNPLFIFGGVGLGKTHLMHAVGNQIKARNPQANVVYLHSERFVNGMVAALRHNRIEEFKNYYRSVDALLIDDIQFFANKTRSMEEFFHTFNVLLECQKQIIMTGDRLPREVENLDDRLQSRLVWGLTVEVEPPDVETRVAILRKKVEHLGLDIPNDVAFFIARRFRSNIRDLEGALLRVIAILRLRNSTTITLDFVQDALRDQLAVMDKMVTMDRIKKLVAEYFNIRVSDLDSKSRARNITRPRQLAMALSKELTNHSLPEIGEKFGGRDHTTVLHACRKVRELVQSDGPFEEAHRILSRTLRS